MTTWAYLLALTVSLIGMVVLDARFKLFFWVNGRRALIVLIVGLVFFLAWDVAGIGAGVFFRGSSPYVTGIQLAPELPLEEIFFLTLLCYLTMNLFEFAGRALNAVNVVKARKAAR
jgi:lycopene cyclase domain-containing protein